MKATETAELYFDAWNKRDADAIVATFATGGTYTDPVTPGALEWREGRRDGNVDAAAQFAMAALPVLFSDGGYRPASVRVRRIPSRAGPILVAGNGLEP